jgi:DNA-binding NarL/FixJ family response regulator
MHSKIDYIVEAFKAGAIGYIIKESASEKLLHGLKSVANDEYFLDNSVSYRIVKNFLESSEKETKVTDVAYCGLTPREQEVMSMLAEGLTKKEIATKFFICQKTVENHRASIMKKLDLHTPIELVRYAVRLGLIDMNI